MNILFLTDGITPYVTGGMQKHSYIMSKLLAKNNCKLTLVHNGYGNQNDFNENYSNIFTPRELEKITPLYIPFPKSDGLPGHYIRQNKLYSKNIKNNIGKSISKYDLIYAQGFTGYSFIKNSFNIPLIVNLHGFEMFQKAPNNKVKLQHLLLRPIVKYLVKNADFVLSFGGQLDKILLKLKVHQSKIIEQSNGIESDWISDKEIQIQPIKTITFIGRNERRKGIEELTSALQRILKQEDTFKFNFIGPIPIDQHIKHKNITYFGEIKDSNVIKDILDTSDFLISPSYAEGMPTVILEAMARGNAIIATDVGANSKLTTNNGILIEYTAESVEKGLNKALKISDSELLSLKINSVQAVKLNFTWEKVIQNQLELFDKLKK